RFKIVVIDIQITLKQMLRDFIGIRVNRAKKSGMVNITSSVNSRERSGINTILHELNPLFTINVTMRDMFTLALVRFPPTATKEIQYLNAKGALTYTDIAGDPVLYGNLPPREISMKDVFRSGDSSKKFK